MTSYFERRAVVIASVTWAAVVGVAAFVSDLIWGVPARPFVAFFGISFWPTAWYLYLRHHYRPELRPGSASRHQADGDERG